MLSRKRSCSLVCVKIAVEPYRNVGESKSFFLMQAGNLLKNFEGISSLVSLKTLHARDNQLESFDGFSGKMKSLEYINVR